MSRMSKDKTAKVYLLLALAGLSAESMAAPPPGAQVMGPQWRGRHLSVSGDVLAAAGPCAQIDVTRASVEGYGRAWLCWPSPAQRPRLGASVSASGQVTSVRMTRVGAAWRPAPVLYVTLHRTARRTP